MKWVYTIIGIVAVGVLALWFTGFEKEQSQPEISFGATDVKIRQEINITNAYLYAGSGEFATSSGMVQVASTSYTGPAAYFEVVASTTAATNATISLVNATSSEVMTSVTVNGTSYARYRSSSFTLPDDAKEYVVVLGNEAVGKGIISSRVVILQNSGSGDLDKTETQIEIGCEETFTTTATTTCAEPKYWTYSSSKWDGTPTFYAEVTYEVINGIASSTDYATAGTFTVVLPGGTASTSIALRGGGGAGDGTNASSVNGYGGGGGGAYVQSTLAATTSSYELIIGAGGTGEATAAVAPAGASSTWSGGLVLASPGFGGALTVAGAGGPASLSTGQVKFNGGDGAAGTATISGAGGEGAGDSADGGDASGTTAGTGTEGGDGGAGRTTENNGLAGTAPGGGGGGAFTPDNTDHSGGSGATGSSTITSFMATSTIVLQEDDGAFGSWTDVANTYMVTSASVGGGEPTRVRTSSAFTPTDGRHYRLALRKESSGTSVAIYNAKVIVKSGLAESIEDSYSEANHDNNFSLAAGVATGLAQAFTVSTNGTLTSAKFYLDNISSSETSVAKIYALSGTYGTNAIPTGAALATSDAISDATIPTELTLMTFSFSGANQIALTATQQYAIAIEPSDGSPSGLLNVGSDTSSPSHGGNKSRQLAGAWAADSAADLVFYVYAMTGSSATKLEPHYLLAPFKLPSGTGLQSQFELFDPAEWSTTNDYLLAVDSANDSTSVVTLKDSTGATTYGTVSSPDNHATSSLTCIPTSSTLWDTAATTNNNDVYGVRVIVQVGGSGTGGCSAGGGNDGTGGNEVIWFIED